MNRRIFAYLFAAILLFLAAGSITSGAAAQSDKPAASAPAPQSDGNINKGKEPEKQTPDQATACAALRDPLAVRLFSGGKLASIRARCAGPAARAAEGKSKGTEAPLVGSDVPINDPTLDTGQNTTQSETSIFADAAGNVVSSYNNSRSQTGVDTLQGWSISHDNGVTWADKGLLTGVRGCCDPMVVWSKRDNVFWIGSLVYDADANPNATSIGLYKSTDNGNSFTYAGVAHAGLGSEGDDRETLVIDNNPASPHYGRMYFLWTDFGSYPTAPFPIKSTYSDSGAPGSWSSPATISGDGSVQGSWASVSSNGDVFVSYGEELTGNLMRQHVARSTNGGTSYTDLTMPAAAASHIRVGAGFTGTCGREAVRGNIRLFGAGKVAAGTNGTAHFVWEIGVSQSGDHGDIWYSNFDGSNWSTPRKLNDDGGTRDQFMVSIVASPENQVSVSWYDRRNAPSDTADDLQYYGVISLDGGQTWGGNYAIGDVVAPLPQLSPNFDPIIADCYYGDYNGNYANSAFTYFNWSDSRRVYDGGSGNRPDPDVYFDKNLNLTDTGQISGVVTDCNSSLIITGVSITARNVVSPELTFAATTNASGAFSMTVAPGRYNITGTKFGYITVERQNVVVTTDGTVNVQLCLAASPNYVVSGTVLLANGNPAAGAAINVPNTPAHATANASGFYSVTLPSGTYNFSLAPPNGQRCSAATNRSVTVPPSHSENFSLPALSDGYYSCDDTQPVQYSPAPNLVSGPFVACSTQAERDDGTVQLNMPFSYKLYGSTFTTVTVSTNGNLQFRSADCAFSNNPLPASNLNYAIVPFWDDQDLRPESGSGNIYTGTTGTAPHRVYTIEFRDVPHWTSGTASQFYTYTVSLFEGQQKASIQYVDMVGDQGSSATSGLQEGDGSGANRSLQYSYNENVLTSGLRVDYIAGPQATATPTVTGTPPTATRTSTTGATATVSRTPTVTHTPLDTKTPTSGPTTTATATGGASCDIDQQATDVPKAITDQSTITSTISIAANVSVASIQVTNIVISHTYPADLDVFLISPHGTRVELFTDVCSGSSNDWTPANTGFTLSDAATDVIGAACPPNNGTYKPEGVLGALAGESAQGTWTLEVTDDAHLDTGVLEGWGLRISATNCSSASATPSRTAGATVTGAAGTATRTPTITPTAPPGASSTATRTPGGGPSPTPCGVSFSDVHPSDYFYQAVSYLACRGVASGYADGTFRPYNLITRGQTVKTMVLSLGFALENPLNPTFDDVPRDDPFYSYVETGVRHGLINGYADNTYRPYSNVTRGQIAKIIVKGEDWAQIRPWNPTFRDVLTDNPFYGFIEAIYSRDIISGYACGAGCLEFHWGDSATRGQVYKVTYLAVLRAASDKPTNKPSDKK